MHSLMPLSVMDSFPRRLKEESHGTCDTEIHIQATWSEKTPQMKTAKNLFQPRFFTSL